MPNSTCLSCMCYAFICSVWPCFACIMIIFKSLWELCMTYCFVWNYKSRQCRTSYRDYKGQKMLTLRNDVARNKMQLFSKHTISVLAEKKSSHKWTRTSVKSSFMTFASGWQNLIWANSDWGLEMLLNAPGKDCKLRWIKINLSNLAEYLLNNY